MYWRGRLVCAVDGTILCCQDTPANLAVYHRGGGYQGGTGYPMVRLLTLVGCGTRAVIDVRDRPGRGDQLRPWLLEGLHAGMIVLADRNFAMRAWIVAVAGAGADMLVRVKLNRVMPVCRLLRDGSYVSGVGPVEVRVITAQITISTSSGRRSEVYRLITTILDPDCPATEIVGLYHERWGATRGRAC